MGDESALEARLERAHTVIGDLLRSLGEIELLPERQQAAAREAVACLEDTKVPDVADFGMRLVDRIRALGILDESELRVVTRRLIAGGPRLRAAGDQGAERYRQAAEAAQHRGAPTAELMELRGKRIDALEATVQRHREQRGQILEALGGVTWEEAVPRARELLQHLHAIRHAAGLSPGKWGDIAATVIERLRGCDERLVRLEALCHQLEDNGVTTTATTWIGNLENGIAKLIDQRDGACARREAEETARIKADANAVFEAQRTDLASAIGVGGSAGATWDWNALVRRSSDLRREHVEMTAAVERINAAHDRGVAMWREITQSEMTLPPVRAELISWLLTKLEDDQREHASYVANLQHAHAHELERLSDIARKIRECDYIREYASWQGDGDWLREATDGELLDQIFARLAEADRLEDELGTVNGLINTERVGGAVVMVDGGTLKERVSVAVERARTEGRREADAERASLVAKLQLVRETWGVNAALGADGSDNVVARVRSVTGKLAEVCAALGADIDDVVERARALCSGVVFIPPTPFDMMTAGRQRRGIPEADAELDAEIAMMEREEFAQPRGKRGLAWLRELRQQRAANHQMAAELDETQKQRSAAERHNKETHELVATALDYPGWERAGWKDLVAAIEREHNGLVAVRAALPPGDGQVPVAQRVTQLVREHGEMVAEMMAGADPEDVAVAAAKIRERCVNCGSHLCPRCGSCHASNGAITCTLSTTLCPERARDLADTVAVEQAVEFIDVVFDGPPGASSGRFVEVEDHRGHSMRVGEWLDRGDGMWALRIPMHPPAEVGEVMAAAGALSALTAVVATSGMNWQRSPCLAWVYGVLVGHDRDVLEDLQMVFNWPDGTVDEIDRHRRALLAARGA